MPSDIESFIAYARTLRTLTAWEALRKAKPVTDVARYGFPASVRRHFHKLDLPRATGSGRRFDLPVQPAVRPGDDRGRDGSRHARQASRCPSELAGSIRRTRADFLAAIQETLEAPWSVAISDFAYAHTTGERPPDLVQRLQYSQALLNLAAQDADVHRLMVEVSQLIKPQSALREPAIAERARALMSPAPA